MVIDAVEEDGQEQSGGRGRRPAAVTMPAAAASLRYGIPGAVARPELTVLPLAERRRRNRSGMFDIQSSQLAEQKSQDPHIKQFGQRMFQDHTKLDFGRLGGVGERVFHATPDMARDFYGTWWAGTCRKFGEPIFCGARPRCPEGQHRFWATRRIGVTTVARSYLQNR